MSLLDLDIEHIVSRILSGIIWPIPVFDFREYFCKLCDLSITPEEVKDLFYATEGYLSDDDCNKFVQGKYPKALDTLSKYYFVCKSEGIKYSFAAEQHLSESIESLESLILSQQTYEGVGKVIDLFQGSNETGKELENIALLNKLSEKYLEIILELYEKFPGPIPRKPIFSGNSERFQIYLVQLTQHMPELVSGMQLSIKLGQTLNFLTAFNPTQSLDPYDEDNYDEGVKLLINPDKFWSQAVEGDISPIIGSIFIEVYPEFTKQMIDMFIEKENSLDYQSQLNTIKAFNMQPDTMKLTQLSQATFLMYNQERPMA